MVTYNVNQLGYNGFNQDEPSAKAIIERIFSELSGDNSAICELRWDFYDDLGYWSQANYAEITKSAMAYYEPYPMQDSWREQYKAEYRAMLANGSAPGVCNLPDDVAYPILRNLIIKHCRHRAPRKLSDLEHQLAIAERGKIYDTDDAAQAAELAYNRTVNEGGYGYVPHCYTAAEVERLKTNIAAYKTLIKNIEQEAQA